MAKRSRRSGSRIRRSASRDQRSPRAPAKPRAQLDALARDVWIADDPSALPRVFEYLAARSGTAVCDVCIATALGMAIDDVRMATARLAKTAHCEQGLWWCAKCSTKGAVTIAIGRVRRATEGTVTPPRGRPPATSRTAAVARTQKAAERTLAAQDQLRVKVAAAQARTREQIVAAVAARSVASGRGPGKPYRQRDWRSLFTHPSTWFGSATPPAAAKRVARP